MQMIDFVDVLLIVRQAYVRSYSCVRGLSVTGSQITHYLTSIGGVI